MNQELFNQWEGIMSDINKDHDLGHAIQELHFMMSQNPLLADGGEIENINRDYTLMKDFMRHGYKDDSREELYLHLLRKTYRAACNMFVRAEIISGNNVFAQANNWVARYNISIDAIKQKLEGFVQDIAFLSLDPDVVQDKYLQLHKSHYDYMRNVFQWLLIARQWNDDEASAFTHLLLSPTIDANDAKLMISALTLSQLNVFDVNKLQVLVDVYLQSTDEYLRQRALVGIAFALPCHADSIFPSYRQMMDKLCQSEIACKELLELQIQVFYCMDADKDNQHIQKEILPTIMKNNNLTITRFGIQEKEEDPMQDILHPDATDKAMEELEKSFQKMKKMQEAGSDIYFGGFSQMKRFPFFNYISNWFVPFYSEHPELQSVNDKLKGTRMLSMLLNSGPFCDSDKYSFALALSSIIFKIPENLREMLNSEDAMMMGAADENTTSPAYIRRMYLQDFYRFFRISSFHHDFRNPFDYSSDTRSFFFANPIFVGTRLHDYMLELCSYLLKRKSYQLLRCVLDMYPQTDHLDFALLDATVAMQNNLVEAQDKFRSILEKVPDHEGALKGYAQVSFNLGDFGAAENGYKQLTSLFPDNQRYLLNLSISQINNNHVDDGVKTLYRLDYEQPTNPFVKRALGWGLMMQGNIKQAIGVYDRLLSKENVHDTDFLNAGYAYWFDRNISFAINLFNRFVSARSQLPNLDKATKLVRAFENDSSLLQLNGISKVERLIMQDIVLNSEGNND